MKKHSIPAVLAMAILIALAFAFTSTASDKTAAVATSASAAAACSPGECIPCPPNRCAEMGITGCTPGARLTSAGGSSSCVPCNPANCATGATGATSTSAAIGASSCGTGGTPARLVSVVDSKTGQVSYRLVPVKATVDNEKTAGESAI